MNYKDFDEMADEKEKLEKILKKFVALPGDGPVQIMKITPDL